MAIAYVFRLATLRLANRCLSGLPSGFVLRRRFLELDLHLEIARSTTHRLLALEGSRFIHERHLLHALAGPGATVLDVGANIGYIGLLLRHSAGASGWIHCFEPESDNLRELERNVLANDLTNVTIHRVAVGASDGMVRLSPGLNGRVDQKGASCVPMVRLDSVVDYPIDLVKVDVEGYEGAVLAGARATLERYRPNLFVEIHPTLSTHSHRQIFDLIEQVYGEYLVVQRIAAATRLQAVRRRYASRQVSSIDDVAALLDQLERGERRDTCWIVACNPGGCDSQRLRRLVDRG